MCLFINSNNSSSHVLTLVNVITVLLHLSCLFVDSTAHLASLFPTCFREERGGARETDWRTPTPDQDNPRNTISAFIIKIINPENPFWTSDSVRILLMQLSSLLVEQASYHIHDANNK